LPLLVAGAEPGQILSVLGLARRAAVMVYVNAGGSQRVSLRPGMTFCLGSVSVHHVRRPTPLGF
jgi:hypothetical protein